MKRFMLNLQQETLHTVKYAGILGMTILNCSGACSYQTNTTINGDKLVSMLDQLRIRQNNRPKGCINLQMKKRHKKTKQILLFLVAYFADMYESINHIGVKHYHRVKKF